MALPKTKKYDLLYPIQGTGRTIEQIELRRLTVGDFITIEHESNSSIRSRKLIEMASGLAPDELEKMDWSDYENLNGSLTSFLSDPDKSTT